MASDLENKIIRQIEFYFGDINLPRDKFLQAQLKEDEGWVPLETMLKFKRLADLTTDTNVIVEALEKAENKIVMVSEDKKKIRRNPDKPVPENTKEHIAKLQERSVYVKGFPLNAELNEIISFMEEYGPSESVIRRTEKGGKFKGSCFIVLKDIETAEKFVALESVKFKDSELLRKMQKVYFSDKKKEIEERKKQQQEKKQKAKDAAVSRIEFPKGAVLHFSGIAEGSVTSREEIKEHLKELSKFEVAFMDYNKGETEGYARFAKENNAVEFFKTLEDPEIKVGEHTLKVKVLEGEEEEEYLKKSSDAIATQRLKSKNSNRKRKGGNFTGGRAAKYARKDKD